MSVVIWHGDCRKVLATMEPDSIDACVTDPPYALGTISKRYGPGQQPTQHPVYARITRGFLGATWDTDVAFQPETWAAVWRVLKPGAALLAFGGTRTFHRLATAIEAAGFVVYDALTWHYAQGFAKTRNSLKPATELIAYARKPISERSVAANIALHGTGGLNVDESRIESVPHPGGAHAVSIYGADGNYTPGPNVPSNPSGRWPSNALFTHSPSCREVGTRKVRTGTHVGRNSTGTEKFSGNYGTGMLEAGTDRGYADPDGTETISMWECGPDCPVRILDEQAGERTSGGRRAGVRKGIGYGGGSEGDDSPATVASTGGASRFFTVTNWTDADLDTARFRYTAKASSAERREGLADRTGHATVKPVSIMGWLVGLVTPHGGTVLDPFFGSGTTGIASQGLGRDISCIGIEQERRWVDDARDRIGMFCEVRETTDGAA